MSHAVLSPSGANIWLKCTPAARLQEQFENKSNDAADEGTLAHSLGELIIAIKTKRITLKKYRELLAIIEVDKFYNKAMFEYCESYALFVLETLAAAQKHTRDSELFIEQKLDLSDYIPEGFGTGDAAIIANDVLDVIDLKYGKGHKVEAEMNAQMRIYALGWLAEVGYLYDVKTIRMTIYQPRMDNISTYEESIESLIRWGTALLRPVAATAFKGEGPFNAGKHCQFCRARVTCIANKDFQLGQIADDFAGIEEVTTVEPVLMAPEEISRILGIQEALQSWLNAVKEYSLTEALTGKQWPGWKLVAGRSMRKIIDKEEVARLLIKDGFDRVKIFKTQELVGVTDLEKLMGKKGFDALIGPLAVKSPGAPALVPESDKREALQTTGDIFAGLTE